MTGPEGLPSTKNSGLLNILQQSVCWLRAKLHLTLARRWSNLWDTWKDWKDEAENHCRVGFCWIGKPVKHVKTLGTQHFGQKQPDATRSTKSVAQHSDVASGIAAPAGALFGPGAKENCAPEVLSAVEAVVFTTFTTIGWWKVQESHYGQGHKARHPALLSTVLAEFFG